MAIIVGAVGGVLYCLASRAVAWMLIDDVIDAFAVHGACGLWSLIAVGLLADGTAVPTAAGTPVVVVGVFYGGGGELLLASFLAAGCIIAWAALLGSLVFRVLKAHGHLRISADFELLGIDISELGQPAYSGAASDGDAPRATVALPISADDNTLSAEHTRSESADELATGRPVLSPSEPSAPAVAVAMGHPHFVHHQTPMAPSGGMQLMQV